MDSRINIFINQEKTGLLSKENKKYIFSYLNEATKPISTTMPLRSESWNSDELHPIFQMNLPEGSLKEQIIERFSKLKEMNDLEMLKLFGSDVIGRVKYALPSENEDHITFEEILNNDTQALFERLMEKFAIRSGISGVQPKVLLNMQDKSTMTSEHYIVKSWGDEYPELAFNEFFCMEACRFAGLPVPEYFLSANRSMFIMKRFDLDKDGSYLGFEDGCVIQGKGADDKYRGGYEDLAKALKSNIRPEKRSESMKLLFKALIMNHLLRNGDGHLKNYGILYREDYTDAVMAPIYDVVCTTVYLPEDVPALNLSGGKLWWKKKTYLNFAKNTCKLKSEEIETIIDQSVRALYKAADEMLLFLRQHNELTLFAHKILDEWDKGLISFEKRTIIRK